MKKLNKFLNFDWEAFSKGKTFMVTECKPWLDYDSKKVLGTKVGFIIIEDKTDYDVSEGEAAVSNVWEKGVIKIRKEINIPENDKAQNQQSGNTVLKCRAQWLRGEMKGNQSVFIAPYCYRQGYRGYYRYAEIWVGNNLFRSQIRA